jgi:hypothetical protein
MREARIADSSQGDDAIEQSQRRQEGDPRAEAARCVA